jgi:hypothetical protein
MSLEEWNEICKEVSVSMADHVKSYVTPISRVISDIKGEHLGSGSYFELDGEKFLITNEHVAKHLENSPLTHKFWSNDNILKLTNPSIASTYPVDVAISKIDDNNWNAIKHESLAIPFDRFAKSHQTAHRELLFFAGYSGERANFCFSFMNTAGTPYLTQEMSFPDHVSEANPDFHFSLPYSPEKAVSVDGSSRLPNPHGFSGSLVWDTKVVACINEGKEWHPELAEVTGIVWGWPSAAACILATKVEHFDLTTLKNVQSSKA